MATATAPSKTRLDISGPWLSTLKMLRRKRWSAAWLPRKNRVSKMISKVPYQPEHYQSVIPYIHATNATKLISFLKEVFDAEEIAIYRRSDGTIGHAASRIGDSVVELADAGPEWPAMPCALQVYVPDTDATY